MGSGSMHVVCVCVLQYGESTMDSACARKHQACMLLDVARDTLHLHVMLGIVDAVCVCGAREGLSCAGHVHLSECCGAVTSHVRGHHCSALLWFRRQVLRLG